MTSSPAADAETTPRSPVAILGALVAFGPLALDTYLPAFPELSRELGASTAAVQLTLTSCLLGLAAGQLVGGTLSDSRGRRPPLLAGVAGFAVASLACAFAPSVWALIVLRFLQGLGGGFGIVIARAVVRDRHAGADAARIYGVMIAMTGLAPILAPTLGALVLHATSWRGIFGLLAAVGAAIYVATLLGLPESLPAGRRHGGGLSTTAGMFRRLVRDRSFVAPALACGLPYGAMFAYISGSPFILQELFGLSPQQFGAVFGVNSIGIVGASLAGNRLLTRLGPRSLLTAGLVAGVAGGLSLLAVVLVGLGLAPFLVALFVTIAAVGLVSPSGTALALSDQSDAAGSASALLGLFQLGAGAAVAPLVGVAGTTTAIPFAVVVAVLETAALVLFLRLARRPAPSAAV